jgi:hypothetical protein
MHKALQMILLPSRPPARLTRNWYFVLACVARRTYPFFFQTMRLDPTDLQLSRDSMGQAN